MKKFLIVVLILFVSKLNCIAAQDENMKSAYKQINNYCIEQDLVGLKHYVNTNNYAQTAISSSGNKLISTCIKKNCSNDMITLLIKNGAKTNDSLIYAINKNNSNAVKCLIKNGVDVNLWQQRKDMPIIYAAKKGNPEIIKMLVNAGANVNVTDKKDNTPLLILCKKNPGNPGIYYLLDAGADLFKLNKYGVSAYSILPSNRKNDVLNYYNDSVSRILSKKFVDKNKKYVTSNYGVPDKKINIDQNNEIWEYVDENEHYIQLKSSTNGITSSHSYKYSSNYSNRHNYSYFDTEYTGGYTVKVIKVTQFDITKNCVSNVKFTSSYHTYR